MINDLKLINEVIEEIKNTPMKDIKEAIKEVDKEMER